MKADAPGPPTVVHVIYRLGVGGLENGLVNLINRFPGEGLRHVVICVTESTSFAGRITRPGVEIVALHKREGKDLLWLARLWRVLRRVRPRIVHTRNLGTLEAMVPAVAAGVRRRVHSEEGWDVYDLHGTRARYRLVRRALAPVIDRWVPVSVDLERWLCERVGIPRDKVVRIRNGVDAERFHPAPGGRGPLPVEGFAGPECFVLGTVGRMDRVKDHPNLARAFVRLLKRRPDARPRLRLVIVGDGPERPEVEAILAEGGATGSAWLPGLRDDVPELLRALDLFVLPSLAEGTSYTLLEAMATGLPVVATEVGGNPEVVAAGATGLLVPEDDPEALSRAIERYLDDPALRAAHGAAGRARVEAEYGLDRMVARYAELYEALLAGKPAPAPGRTP